MEQSREKRVFCSDMTFDATLNPVVYEGGTPVFIDTEKDSWNMDPVALEKAFEMYPEVKLVVSAELYGFSGDIKRLKKSVKNTEHFLSKTQQKLWERHGMESSVDLMAIMQQYPITETKL